MFVESRYIAIGTSPLQWSFPDMRLRDSVDIYIALVECRVPHSTYELPSRTLTVPQDTQPVGACYTTHSCRFRCVACVVNSESCRRAGARILSMMEGGVVYHCLSFEAHVCVHPQAHRLEEAQSRAATSEYQMFLKPAVQNLTNSFRFGDLVWLIWAGTSCTSFVSGSSGNKGSRMRYSHRPPRTHH